MKIIPADVDISVHYQQDGYYEAGCHYKMCTNMDPRDLNILRQNMQAEKAKREAEAAGSVELEGAGLSLLE